MMCMQRDVCACEVQQEGGGMGGGEGVSPLCCRTLSFPPALIFALLRDPKRFHRRVYIELNASFA